MSTWALVGSPNSGKTTLYNWLTGSRSKTVNYPGSTVEYNVGNLRPQLSERINNAEIKIVDTPGVYSLNPQSEDERVTHDVLFNTSEKLDHIDAILMVLDATQLSRHLMLAKQVIDSGYPAVFVVTMRDLIEKEGAKFHLEILKEDLGADVILFDGILGRGLDELIQILREPKGVSEKTPTCPTWTITEQTEVIAWAESLNQKTISRHNSEKSALKFTDSLDKLLMHPILGFVMFFVFMTILFSAIYWMAHPVMDLIDSGFSYAADKVTTSVPGLTGQFLGSGLIAAIGGVVIFVPQIFILFFGIGLLESTGYLARVAALIDKPLSLVGLGGRSFVPLLSGFACAIPAIMATRNITSKKEKLIAQSIIPFMTCSARLPVYALMIGFLYGNTNPLLAGFIMSLMYFGAILVGAIAARVISVFLKEGTSSRLMMELPLYRRPRFGVLLVQCLNRSKSFVIKAGPIIFTLAVVLWFATNFPRPDLTNGAPEKTAAEIAQQSYAAQVGRVIEPVFKPMGLDWRVGFGLISAFAAREVFVSSLALMFNVESSAEDVNPNQGLTEAMKNASFPDGSKIFTTATVAGVLIFFMIALQCTSTVGILRRETGSWTPALMQLFLSNLVAYLLAVAVVHFLQHFGL